MKKIVMAALLACSLSACAGFGNTVYSASAKAQGSADTLYVAAEKAGEVLVATKVITLAQFNAAETKAYAALQVFRSASLAVRAAATTGSDTTAMLVAEADALAKFNQALADFQKLAHVAPAAATTL